MNKNNSDSKKKPDWLSMQYDSYERFFSKEESLPEFCLQRLIENESYDNIQIDENHTLSITGWELREVSKTSEECIQSNTDYCRDLRMSFAIKGPAAGNKPYCLSRQMMSLPCPTKDSEFVLSSKKGQKANRYTMTMQLVRSPGIYYKERYSGEELVEKMCNITPVCGNQIKLKDKKGKQFFWMNGLKISLDEFQMLIDEDNPVNNAGLLHYVYGYLNSHGLVPKDSQLFSSLESAAVNLSFVQHLFIKHIRSFDMSRLGKIQMSLWLGGKINDKTTKLNLNEIKEIINCFTQETLSVTDDRSLKNRKVKLIGDFLYVYFDIAFKNFFKKIIENWKEQIVNKPHKSSDDSVKKIRLSLCFPYRSFEWIVKRLFKNNELIQLLDDTNPVAEISQKRRLTFRGPGGMPDNVIFLDHRDVHPTDYGRLCPVETPQGADLGFNLYLAKDARINSSGMIETLYINLENQKEQFLDPFEEEEILWAASSEIKNNKGEPEYVYARNSKEEIALIPQSELSHRHHSAHGFLGYTASLIPFFQHNDANRSLMGAGMMKQALPLINPETPYISTGLEDEIVKNYDRPSPFIKKGQLCLGRNLLTGYMPWDLLNYEDGIVISQTLVEKNLLTHVETEEKIIEEIWFKDAEHFEEITPNNIYLDNIYLDNIHLDNIHLYDEGDLDEFGVIKQGSQIEPDTLLVSRICFDDSSIGGHTKAATDKTIKEFIIAVNNLWSKKKIERFYIDNSIYAPQNFYGTVKSVKWECNQKWEDECNEGYIEKPDNAEFKEAYYFSQGAVRRLCISIEKRRSVQTGDKLTGRHGNKGVISKILPENQMPYFKTLNNKCSDSLCEVKDNHTHLEILINPLTVTGRKNLGQLYETTSGWIVHNNKDIEKIEVPIFSSEWNWAKITDELKKNKLNAKQKIYYMEGENEIELKRPVTVGYQYFLKLKHLAENKLKARDKSTYSPITGQPLVPSIQDPWKRKEVNRKTAQRLGEMEVWALEGHSAWNILDEFLFLKSDDEKLRYMIVEINRESGKIRKKTFKQFWKKVNEYGWNDDNAKLRGWEIKKEGDDITVKCPSSDEEDLMTVLRDLGLVLEKKDDGASSIIFKPFEFIQREYRAFKMFVHYCRALGLEIEAVGNNDEKITLINTDKSSWPKFSGISIRIASDDDRKKWAQNKIIKKLGSQENGLWSNSIFGNTGDYQDKVWSNEASGIIQLAVPVDNPLFRPVLKELLNREGFVLSEIKTVFEKILKELFPEKNREWDDFWEQAYKEHSQLLTGDDLLDWIETIDNGSCEKSRKELAQVLEKKLTKEQQFNFQDIFNPKSKYYDDESRIYLDYRTLYHHFSVMDLEKFKQKLQSVVKINKKDTKTFDMINTMIDNQYPPTILFITNLYVLPKNLRFEKDRIFNPRGKTDVSLGKYPSYQNDLNILYQKIITQNKKIINFRENQAPDLIIKHEENKLHKLVYGLLINNKMNNILPEPLFRPGSEKILDSVMSRLVGNKSGKEGIFRKHLLGKRVDFSGRGVIIPDPDLKLDEAGLPYKAGKILFRDQLINRVLKLKEFSETKHDTQTGFRKIPFKFRLRRAEAFLSDPNQQSIVKSWMDELSNKYYILLNRAPSLHRLSIMAFYPKFYDDEDVIRLNPYVCAPFNADFDGDTMAVHVPMLPLSLQEAAKMLPSKILRSAGHGQLVINYKADQALACYLLTQSKQELDNLKKINGDDFSDLKVSMNADKLYSLFDNWQKEPGENYKDKIHKLTPIFRKILNKSGLSLGVDDFILDPKIRQKIKEFEVQFQQEKLSYEKSEDRVNYWNKKSEGIEKQVVKILKELPKDTSPVQILLDSGSGVSEKDLAQLSGMRGIMNRPGGKCLDYPVCSNIVDGMTPLDYFISCHGSRHGLADKGLMTGPAGDLTNIIMQAVQADYIVEDDCGTEQGLYFSAFADLDGRLITLEKRITGRYLAENLLIEHENIAIGTLVDEKIASKIHNSNIKEIKLFSPVTCESVNGVCKKCYGLDLATGLKPPEGFPAGVIAAQSIGEPGTQLTLRTFHTGGTATNQEISQGLTVARKAFSLGIIEEHVKSFINGTAKIIETNNKMRWFEIKGTDLKGDKKTQKIPVFWFDPVSNGFEVKIDQRIFHTIKFCDKQYISIHEVCATFGPITTAEYLLHVFQRIYSKNSAVADHHFEIVLKKILYPLNAGVSSDNEQESSVLKSVLKVGQNTPGFLSRLAFRNISGNLTWAAFRNETDKLQGLKEKLIAGKIRN